MKQRISYALCCIVVIGLGLGSRRFGAWLPTFVATYAGDTLWAGMAYLGISFCSPSWSILRRSGLALVFSFLIEISQLYHAPWIDSIRSTTPGALVLGHGFLWSDLVCYSVGIASIALLEYCIRGRPRQTESRERQS